MSIALRLLRLRALMGRRRRRDALEALRAKLHRLADDLQTDIDDWEAGRMSAPRFRKLVDDHVRALRVEATLGGGS